MIVINRGRVYLLLQSTEAGIVVVLLVDDEPFLFEDALEVGIGERLLVTSLPVRAAVLSRAHFFFDLTTHGLGDGLR